VVPAGRSNLPVPAAASSRAAASNGPVDHGTA
jgi:hypothetical protein